MFPLKCASLVSGLVTYLHIYVFVNSFIVMLLCSRVQTFDHSNQLKGEQRPAAFAIVCFCFCEYRTVSYSGSCGEQVAEFMQSMMVFALPLMTLFKMRIML